MSLLENEYFFLKKDTLKKGEWVRASFIFIVSTEPEL